MMTMTTPDKLAMASGAARAAIQAASDYVGRAAGDYGIDARDDNARILHDCIERQQDAIGALWKMVDELQAQVARLAEGRETEKARPLTERMRLEGYRPGRPRGRGVGGDVRIAEEPCECGNPRRQYRPFVSDDGGYRAFSVCTACGTEVEF